jgi:alpha-tubulin suppressor-like RCC1 family protein
LGLGADQSAPSPSLVPDVLGTDGLVVSGNHTCVLSPQTRYCWGQNDLGQLGNGVHGSAEPIPIAMDNTTLGLTALTAGFQHTCGLAQDAIWCWGHNETGELGLGMASEPELSPTRVGTGFARVSAGGAHTCGLKIDGQLECWGLNESLELGVPAGRVVPAALRPGCDMNGAGKGCFSDWTAVGAGGFHTCAIRDGGQLYCWGGNRDGQLGIGPLVASEDFVEPQRVAADVLWSEVAGGLHFSCALDLQGALYCWGRNESHQLALPTEGTVWTPTRVEVDAPAGFRLLSLGENHACAIRADRTLWCWGRNVEGQIGIGKTSEAPMEKPTRVCF